MTRRIGVWVLGVLLVAGAIGVLGPRLSRTQGLAPAEAARGAGVTHASDGRWLVTGGLDPDGHAVGTIAVRDAVTGLDSPLHAALRVPRAWHTATVLPDGSVLVLGGIGSDGRLVDVVERVDPASGRALAVGTADPPLRALHTATLLMDGRILVAGGIGADGRALATLEVWDPDTLARESLAATLGAGRFGHTARLLADGCVRLSGGDGVASPDEVVDPSSGTVVRADAAPIEDAGPPALAASVPADGAAGVAVDGMRIALRFTRPIVVETATAATVVLGAAGGVVAVRIVVAEDGMLGFVTPSEALLDGTTYALVLDGLASRDGQAIARTVVYFTTDGTDAVPPVDTAGAAKKKADRPDPSWTPTKDWKSGLAPSRWQRLPPLRAPNGVTAIAGQVLRLDGEPLADVTLAIGDVATRTDTTGRFLLMGVPAGRVELVIDGRSASRPGRTYGLFEYGMTVEPGITNVLGFTSWMPALDTAHAVDVAAPTRGKVVVTTPRIAGLELHIPAGSTIRDRDGRPATRVGITPIPVDRPPFPLPERVEVPIYFTIQPGGGYVQNASWTGASLVYPNYTGKPARSGFKFWHYDPERAGWHVYGAGRVTADRRQVVPDDATLLYEFTGAMISNDPVPPARGPKDCAEDGDPVNLGTGLFVFEQTDLVLGDVLPLELTRTYRPADPYNRPFGIGTNHSYALFLWSNNLYQDVDLALPDGGRVHYVRTSPGTGYVNAVFEHPGPTGSCPICAGRPSRFFGSRITWNGEWDLQLKDGTVYVFGEYAPLQSIRDRSGNQITIERAGGSPTGNITRIASPNGRWIDFTYDASDRITQATDNGGRTYSYQYDAQGRLAKVTDPLGGQTQLGYDSRDRMTTVKNPRGITYVTNQYDANDRASRQTHADGGVHQFAYATDGAGNVTRTDVTDPSGTVRRVLFDASGYTVSDTEALGRPEERTTTTTRQAGTNLAVSRTDGLGRRTDSAYDANGNVTSITRLAGTASAVTTTYAYEPVFNRTAAVTDPLGHAAIFTHDATGTATGISDPLGNAWTVAANAAGQVTAVTDPLGNVTRYGYSGGDLTSITDPTGAVTRRFVNGVGELRSVTDPLGRRTAWAHDALGRITQVVDAAGGAVTLAYDADGHLTQLVDQRGSRTIYTYDVMDHLATRVDPLGRTESFTYDLLGNLATWTDRKAQVTAYAYDALARRTFAGFNRVGSSYESTVAVTYDAGDRTTRVADSANGTITRTYDGLDRITSETTAQGSISYAYDAASRRVGMTLAGSPATSYTYGYDAADRLTSLAQGNAAVALSYDAMGHRSTLTLPNGIVLRYAYDAAGRVRGITGKEGATTVLDLRYGYDAAGNPTSVDGDSKRTSLPSPSAATYDAANELQTWSGAPLAYDANGNLVTDGTTTYTWNARNQLTGLAGGGLTASFAYDAIGRRTHRTVNGTSTTFLYDELNRLKVTEGGTTSLMLEGLAIDEHFASIGATGVTSFLTDALGSTHTLTDDAGAPVAEYAYEPFGRASRANGAGASDLLFTGRDQDATGLGYYRARYYSPTFARFIGEDPLRFGGGDANLHAYVRDSPLKSTDPLGLLTLTCQRPLDHVPGKKWVYRHIPAAHHAYHCIVGPNGSTECAGLGPAGLIPFMTPGIWEPDTPHRGECEQTRDDDDCYENCLRNMWGQSFTYDLGFFHCQTINRTINDACSALCGGG